MTYTVRSEIARAIAGVPQMHVIRVSQRGEYPDLSTKSIVVRGRKADGSTLYTPAKTVPSQVDKDRGVLQIFHAASDLDQTSSGQAGRPYLLDVLIGDSAGTETPVDQQWCFYVRDKETTA